MSSSARKTPQAIRSDSKSDTGSDSEPDTRGKDQVQLISSGSERVNGQGGASDKELMDHLPCLPSPSPSRSDEGQSEENVEVDSRSNLAHSVASAGSEESQGEVGSQAEYGGGRPRMMCLPALVPPAPSTVDARFNASRIRQKSVFCTSSLVELAEQDNLSDDIRIAALCSLEQFTREEESIEVLDRNGVVRCWVTICQTHDAPAQLQSLAARGIANLAVHDSIRVDRSLAKHGCIESLVQLLLLRYQDDAEDRNINSVLYAVLQALSHLSEKHVAACLISGVGMQALVNLMQHPSEQMVQRAGWLFCMVMSQCLIPGRECVNAGLLPALIQYGSRSGSQAQEEAAWVIASLSREADYAIHLAQSYECLRLLDGLLLSDIPQVQVQAAWGLANLSLQPAGVLILCEISTVRTIMTTLTTFEGHDEILLLQLSRCLGTLLTHEDARVQLLTMPLETTPHSTAAMGGTTVDRTAQFPFIQRLLSLARLAISPDAQYAAMRSLTHACFQPESLAKHIVHGVFPTLVSLLGSPHERIQSVTLSCVVNVVANAEVRASGVDLSPLVKPVVELLHREDTGMQLKAAMVLDHMSGSLDIAVLIAKARALGRIHHMLRSSDPNIQDVSSRVLIKTTRCLSPNSCRVYMHDSSRPPSRLRQVQDGEWVRILETGRSLTCEHGMNGGTTQ